MNVTTSFHNKKKLSNACAVSSRKWKKIKGWTDKVRIGEVDSRVQKQQDRIKFEKKNIEKSSVADPDPPDPRVFGPPGSGSGSFYHHAKIVRTLIPTIL